ncbi:MAG: DNA polymerase I, partial [Coriobacteriales bacterium]|nr:DNA polymerase I [Coriobacteriales bacterium]
AALIVKYGNLDQVIAHADEVKGKMGENLRAHVDDALLSRKVATIRTDAPIDVNLADAKFPTFDPVTVTKAFSDLGFTTVVGRLVALSGEEPVSTPAVGAMKLPDPLTGTEAMDALDAAIAAGKWVGAAFQDPQQHKGQQSLFDEGPKQTVWLYTGEELLRVEGDDAVAAVAALVRQGKVASGDVKLVLHVAYPMDSADPAAFDEKDVDPARIYDVAVADYLLESDRSGFEPVDLMATRCPHTVLPEPTDDVPQAALDAVAALVLMPTLEDLLKTDGTLDLFHKLEMGLLPVLLQMERTGLYADPAKLGQQSAELGAEIDQMVAHIHEEAGEEFNLDSPQQLSHVLFDVWKLPTAGLKKTRKGFYSTNAKTLGDLAAADQRVQEVLDYRERAKIKSTYLDALPELIRKDGRIHTTFNQTVAATGRLSSSDPNLQNIPTRSQLGHRVRTAFTVPEGSVFLACDYSQIELRLLAHLSGDEHLIEAFCKGEDFHRSTAARVFGVPFDEVTPQMRSRAKAVNFGIVYGQQAYGLATSLKIPRAEAQQMIDRYFEAYPGVRKFLDAQIAFAHKNRYVQTMYGRKRHTKDIDSRNYQLRSFAERTAMNHPVQGTAADIIKMAMVQVPGLLRKEGLRSKLVLQIHDELDFEVPKDEIEPLTQLVKDAMQGVAQLRVPLIAEVSYGDDWAQAK